MFGDLNLTYCFIYLDGVIVYTKTLEEHPRGCGSYLTAFRNMASSSKTLNVTCLEWSSFIWLTMLARMELNCQRRMLPLLLHAHL